MLGRYRQSSSDSQQQRQSAADGSMDPELLGILRGPAAAKGGHLEIVDDQIQTLQPAQAERVLSFSNLCLPDSHVCMFVLSACAAVCVAEPSQVLQCLAYIKLLLQQLPSGRPVPDEGAAISFDSLWETLLLLALKQEQPEIR